MKPPRMLELFSGTERMSHAFEREGWFTASVDTDHPATIRKSVHDLTRWDIETALGAEPSVIWASPPCNGFTVAVVSRNWNKNGDVLTPKSDSARESIALLRRTLEIASWFPNATLYIENPRGMMRKMKEVEHLTRHTVTYCAYGETRMKPTDVFTNSTAWTPRRACKNGDPCHESAPRGSKTGTQGIKGSYLRSALPLELCEEIARTETEAMKK